MKKQFRFITTFILTSASVFGQSKDSSGIVIRGNPVYFVDGVKVYPAVRFETDSLIIKADTSVFFKLIDKNYSGSIANDHHRQLIKSEVRYRLKTSDINGAQMDGMVLNCYTDKERRSYLAGCLNYNEALTLVQLGQAQVFYKNPFKEIISYKVKRKGSKFRGHVDRIYIDKSTSKVFYTEPVCRHKWWKRHEGCKLPY